MRIPQGMTENEVISVMKELVEKIAKQYTFGYLTVEDLEQEGYLECMDALERYDGRGPLINFLSVNLKNRLFNFRRDEYYRYNPRCEDECQCRFCRQKEDKKNLLNPQDLFEYSEELIMDDNSVELTDLLNKIDRALPTSLRPDYLKLKSGAKLPKKRKDAIIQKLKDIAYGTE
jgi:RNA polymerase sigma factor (sigma-70 family)